MSANSDMSVKNRILSALPAEEYKRLLPNLKPVTLEYKQVLYEPNKPIRYVYFPNNGVICLLSTVIRRTAVEIGLLGNVWMLGIPIFLGPNSPPPLPMLQPSH